MSRRVRMFGAALVHRLVDLFVMERKLLLGIKERAGRLTRQHTENGGVQAQEVPS
ncbi:hypothetical protein ACFPIJ_16220 [Dactylosporangium cerinum]|uniref:Uncharacterized protein n=1 Tax=Dactylosporangium cerinum TaxID=1434730 RepID=A0ABV9VSK2_9ACTN